MISLSLHNIIFHIEYVLSLITVITMMNIGEKNINLSRLPFKKCQCVRWPHAIRKIVFTHKN